MNRSKIVLIGVIVIIIIGIGSYLFADKKVSLIGGGGTFNPAEEIRKATNPVSKNKIAQANVKKYRVKFIDGSKPNTMAVMEKENTESGIIVHRFTVADGKVTAELIDVMDKKYITNYVHDLAGNSWWKKTEENKIEESLKEILKNITPTKKRKDDLSPTPTPTKILPQATRENCPKNPDRQCYKVTNEILENYSETIYFDTKDFLTRMASNNRTKDTTEYEYENISIILPSDAQEVPAGKNVLDYYHPTMLFVF